MTWNRSQASRTCCQLAGKVSGVQVAICWLSGLFPKANKANIPKKLRAASNVRMKDGCCPRNKHEQDARRDETQHLCDSSDDGEPAIEGVLHMEPFRAVQAVLASNFQVMCQGEAQSHCCTQQAHETQCFRQHVPSPSSGHPKGTGTSSQDRQYYLSSRQPLVSSETLMHSADEEA